jgi:hypothetical protein
MATTQSNTRTQSQGETGTQDVTYDLVSIIYHALQGAETYDQFIEDAQQSGDHDLAQFFNEVKEENTRRANRAKELLAERLGRGQKSESRAGRTPPTSETKTRKARA